MGLFSKSEEIVLPSNALNLSFVTEKGFRGIWLETEDGYITKNDFIPENMYKVKAIVTGSKKSGIGEIRIPINEITSFEFEPLFEKIPVEMALKNGFFQPHQLIFEANGKKYSCMAGDNISFDDLKEIFDNAYAGDSGEGHEGLEAIANSSCLNALKHAMNLL